MTVDADVPGIDASRLTRWLGEHAADAGALESVELISGGRSNLTYRLTCGGRPLVLRRPPLGHVLPTAHDMSREYRVLSALAATEVPVPEPIALCTDEDVIGAPFYLMSYVEGLVLRTEEDAEAAEVTPERARGLSERLAVVLAMIHTVDPEAVGLAGFGRPHGYLERQLRRWQQQWERSVTRELPAYDRLVTRLAESMPAHQDAALVHGDYRLDNALVRLAPVPEIAAVVDWEMSTLGDPLADLGLTLTYWADAGDEQRLAIPVGATATARPGFFTRKEFASRYAELTGRDVASVDYYIAFGCFKLAVVLEGIHARFLQSKTVGAGFAGLGDSVPVLIDRAHQILDEGKPR